MNQLFTINSLKYNRSLYRSWTCEIVEHHENLLVFLGVFEFDVEHQQLGHIKRGTISYEFYWLDRWYNVFRFHEPDGEFRNFYCNVNMPPKLDGTTLEYVDLDLDLLVWPDGRVIDLDMKEFRENAARYTYPLEIISNAMKAVEDLKYLIDSREFPFDGNYLPR